MSINGIKSFINTFIEPLPSRMALASEADFRRLLRATVSGTPDAHLLARFHQALLSIQAEPGGDILLSALRAHAEATGIVPQVVLDDSSAAFRTRPQNGIWYVDLDAIERNPASVGRRTLARLYEHLAQPTARGLASMDPTCLPRPDEKLEQSWDVWLKAAGQHEQRAEALERIRGWIRETGYYGGITRTNMLDLLYRIEHDQSIPDYVAELNLRNLGLKSLPHFHSSTRAVDASDNCVADIEPLPSTLETLKLNRNRLDDTCLRRILEKLPNSVNTLELNNNGFSAITTALPENLQRLSISDNALHALPALPFGLEVLDASDNLILDADALNALSALTNVDLRNNKLSAIPRAIMRLSAGSHVDLRGNMLIYARHQDRHGFDTPLAHIENMPGMQSVSVPLTTVSQQFRARIALDPVERYDMLPLRFRFPAETAWIGG